MPYLPGHANVPLFGSAAGGAGADGTWVSERMCVRAQRRLQSQLRSLGEGSTTFGKVRLVSATSAGIAMLSVRGRSGASLYFGCRFCPIVKPPLRDGG